MYISLFCLTPSFVRWIYQQLYVANICTFCHRNTSLIINLVHASNKQLYHDKQIYYWVLTATLFSWVYFNNSITRLVRPDACSHLWSLGVIRVTVMIFCHGNVNVTMHNICFNVVTTRLGGYEIDKVGEYFVFILVNLGIYVYCLTIWSKYISYLKYRLTMLPMLKII